MKAARVRQYTIIFLLGLLGCAVSVAPVAATDENLLAHRLFAEGRYGEAAEIFTDPAWKGVAFYRSAQWWRAADAFVRADDAASAHNLGNAYVKLGYYALALQAYQRALALEPALEQARFNADLMRRILALSEDDGQSGGATRSDDEIERLSTDAETPADAGRGQGGEEESDTASEEQGPGEAGTGRESDETRQDAEQIEQERAEDGEKRRQNDEGSGSVNGIGGDDMMSNPGGGQAESSDTGTLSESAARRSDIESEQATEQWLNRIAHDPREFLARRIALESRRRQATGKQAPEGGSGW